MTASIVQVTDADIDEVRAIFREYEQWVGLNLCFQSFEEELAALPGFYAPPDGRLYLAWINGEAVGCIGMRKLEAGVCEMKRLYLREAARGLGVGRAVSDKGITEAREIGYLRMRLDTDPPKMEKAVRLYESYGFHEIPPYYDNPYGKTLFMEKPL